jgi:hypothetical protein
MTSPPSTMLRLCGMLRPPLMVTGQTIAIVGETDINPQDIADFRNFFGLPAGLHAVLIESDRERRYPIVILLGFRSVTFDHVLLRTEGRQRLWPVRSVEPSLSDYSGI